MILLYSIKNGEILFNEKEKKIIKYTKKNEYIYDFLNNLFNIHNINRHFIEFEISNKILHFDKKTIKTFMIILDTGEENVADGAVTTNIIPKLLITNNFNSEKYKYKNYDDIDNSLITTIKKNKIIIYDNDNIIKEIGVQNVKILYINIIDVDSRIHHFDEKEEEFIKLFENVEIENVKFNNDVITEDTFENILYGNDDFKMTNENTYITLSFDDDKNDFITKTYGADLLPLLNTKLQIDKNNNFYRNKLYKNVLTHEICNWMVTEYEKNKELVKNTIYKNYSNMLNVKEISGLISYVLYFSSFFLNQVYIDYGLKVTNNFYPTEIFICKYLGSKTFNPDIDNHKFYEKRDLNTDNFFLSINILLNDNEQYIANRLSILDEDYPQNSIGIDDDDGIIIEKGDAVVYNGRKKRTSGNVIAGSKYVLVIFIKLKI